MTSWRMSRCLYSFLLSAQVPFFVCVFRGFHESSVGGIPAPLQQSLRYPILFPHRTTWHVQLRLMISSYLWICLSHVRLIWSIFFSWFHPRMYFHMHSLTYRHLVDCYAGVCFCYYKVISRDSGSWRRSFLLHTGGMFFAALDLASVSMGQQSPPSFS